MAESTAQPQESDARRDNENFISKFNLRGDFSQMKLWELLGPGGDLEEIYDKYGCPGFSGGC